MSRSHAWINPIRGDGGTTCCRNAMECVCLVCWFLQVMTVTADDVTDGF